MLVSHKKVVQRWKVPDSLSGIRADHYLVHHIGRISRTRAQRIIESGDFKLCKSYLKPSRRLKSGEAVELWRVPPDTESALPKNIEVIFENSDFLVLNKPANLAIHPSARYLYETLTHWLKINYPGEPAHPCHRLDRETSGLVICAKRPEVESEIKQAFMLGKVRKTYVALVEGRMPDPISCRRSLSLQGSKGLVGIKMIEDLVGSYCHTEFKPLEYNPILNWSLVECKPLTGRQHQIRAHLALEGFPIVGDKLYAMGEVFFDAYTRGEANLKLLPLPRQALHAQRIEFELGDNHYVFEAANPFFEEFQIPKDLS